MRRMLMAATGGRCAPQAWLASHGSRCAGQGMQIDQWMAAGIPHFRTCLRRRPRLAASSVNPSARARATLLRSPPEGAGASTDQFAAVAKASCKAHC